MPRANSGQEAAPRDGTQREPVNPADAVRLSAALARASLNPRAAARLLGRSPRMMQRWLAGQRAVPPGVLEALWAEAVRRERDG